MTSPRAGAGCGAGWIAGSTSAPGSEVAAGDGETWARLTQLPEGQRQRPLKHLGRDWGFLGLQRGGCKQRVPDMLLGVAVRDLFSAFD